MTYILTAPEAMRIFDPVSPGARQLRQTGRILAAGQSIRITDVAVVVYDHHDKLAFKMEKDLGYLLIQEIREARDLTYVWTALYEEKATIAVQQTIAEKLSLVLRKHFRPLLRLVSDDDPPATFDQQGPGIHVLPPLL